jgi:hypothetical protein
MSQPLSVMDERPTYGLSASQLSKWQQGKCHSGMQLQQSTRSASPKNTRHSHESSLLKLTTSSLGRLIPYHDSWLCLTPPPSLPLGCAVALWKIQRSVLVATRSMAMHFADPWYRLSFRSSRNSSYMCHRLHLLPCNTTEPPPPHSYCNQRSI